jgi:hypothetical protein
MFGYLTAIIATVFIDRAVKDPKEDLLRAAAIEGIRREIIQLRRVIEEALNRPSQKK